VLQADRIRSQPDLETVAEGRVEFRRGGTVIKADRLAYDTAQDLAAATGAVRVSRGGAIYWGPELQLRVQRFEGFVEQPRFELERQGAGGSAARVDFLDSSRSVATDARYTSCPRDGSGDPDWVLQADSVSLDVERNEGVAEGAVLRFLGTPILALLGAVGAALTLGLRGGGMLLALLVLPLYVPILILGAGCVAAAAQGLPYTGALLLLGAGLALLTILAPLATATALRIAMT